MAQRVCLPRFQSPTSPPSRKRDPEMPPPVSELLDYTRSTKRNFVPVQPLLKQDWKMPTHNLPKKITEHRPRGLSPASLLSEDRSFSQSLIPPKDLRGWQAFLFLAPNCSPRPSFNSPSLGTQATWLSCPFPIRVLRSPISLQKFCFVFPQNSSPHGDMLDSLFQHPSSSETSN